MEPKRLLVKLNAEQLDELVSYLLGSTNTLNQGLALLELTVEQLDPSSFDDIDSDAFLCDWCGYWCDSSDNCGDQCCYQCSSEEKDDTEDEGELIDYLDNALNDGDDF